MRKALAVGLLSAFLVLPSATVRAGGYYYGYGGHHHGHGDDALIALGIIGGAILLGSLLSPPRNYAPPVYYPRAPIYYRPAPAYAQTCYRDRVWRRLQDGRIQYGTRTRCY